MNSKLETIWQKTIGRFTVEVEKHFDESPDFSHLGEFTDKQHVNPGEYLYHRNSGLMFDGKTWRDSKGRIQSEPNLDSYRDGARFILHDASNYKGCTNSEKFRYCFQDCKELTRIDEDWHYIGVWAKVYLNGREVGSNSLWGIEEYYFGEKATDSESYIMASARDCVREAVHDARGFLKSVCV